MIGRLIAELDRILTPAGPPTDAPDVIRCKLGTKCNAEIAARITRRAEIHDDHGGYHARCSPLDREAAQRIIRLERRIAELEGRDPGEFEATVDHMLIRLREP